MFLLADHSGHTGHKNVRMGETIWKGGSIRSHA